MPAVIDIHPHIIATDPSAIRARRSAATSRIGRATRPVIAEQMIAAMDDAGIAKAAIVQASTCYGHDNSYVADAVAAHPEPLHRRVLGRRAGAGCHRAHALLDGPRPDRHAAVHHRQHHAGAGVLARRSENLSGLADGRRSWPLRSACRCRPHGIPQLVKMLERFPQVRILLDHWRGRCSETARPMRRRGSLFGLARYPSVYLKLTQRNFEQAQERQGDAGDVLPETGRRIRRAAARLGLQLSGVRRLAAGSS